MDPEELIDFLMTPGHEHLYHVYGYPPTAPGRYRELAVLILKTNAHLKFKGLWPRAEPGYDHRQRRANVVFHGISFSDEMEP